jgi:phosphatidylglycerol---prolipoprotein diacylglyceryl transferase
MDLATAKELAANPLPIGINFPAIDPVALQIGPLAIRWYALAYVIGIVLGWKYIGYLRRRFHNKAMSDAAFEQVISWCICGILFGGRLGYVLFYNPSYYFSNPSEILAVWKGGMSFHGGLCGVILSIFIMCKRYQLRFIPVMDLLAAASPIGLFFGRIANFINGELYGRPTDMAWGIIFPYSDGLARHPSQLYEAFAEGLILFILLYSVIKRGGLNHTGRLSGLFLSGYAIARLIIENFREPDAHIGLLWNLISMGQLLCLPMLLLGIYLVWNTLQKPQTRIKNHRHTST